MDRYRNYLLIWQDISIIVLVIVETWIRARTVSNKMPGPWARILEENYIIRKNFRKYDGFLLTYEK